MGNAWPSFTGQSLSSIPASKSSLTMEYIPSGMSKEQWEKIKAKDKSKTAGKDLGKTGVTSFKSRSFAEWQKDGGKHLFPVDPKKVKSVKEIPYMQRAGGSADDSDIKGTKKKKGLFGLNSACDAPYWRVLTAFRIFAMGDMID